MGPTGGRKAAGQGSKAKGLYSPRRGKQSLPAGHGKPVSSSLARFLMQPFSLLGSKTGSLFLWTQPAFLSLLSPIAGE